MEDASSYELLKEGKYLLAEKEKHLFLLLLVQCR